MSFKIIEKGMEFKMNSNSYLYETEVSMLYNNVLKRKNYKYSDFLASKSDIKKINKYTTDENRKNIYSKLDSLRIALNKSDCKYSDKLIALIDNINIKNSEIIRKQYIKSINGSITKKLKSDIQYLESQIEDIRATKKVSSLKKIKLKIFKTEKKFTQEYLYLPTLKKHFQINMSLKDIQKIKTYKKFINSLQNPEYDIDYFSKLINTQLINSKLFTLEEKKQIFKVGEDLENSDIYGCAIKRQTEMKRILSNALKNENNNLRKMQIEKMLNQISYDPYMECLKLYLPKIECSNENLRLCIKNCYSDMNLNPRQKAKKILPILQQELLLAKSVKQPSIPRYTFDVSKVAADSSCYKFNYYDENEALVKSSLYSIPEINANLNIKSRKITTEQKYKILNKLIKQLTLQNSGRSIMDELKIDISKPAEYDEFMKLNPYILYMLKEEDLLDYAKVYISQRIKPIGYKMPITMKKAKSNQKVRTSSQLRSYPIGSAQNVQYSYDR